MANIENSKEQAATNASLPIYDESPAFHLSLPSVADTANMPQNSNATEANDKSKSKDECTARAMNPHSIPAVQALSSLSFVLRYEYIKRRCYFRLLFYV
ncbi:MAG TPA: hypothetical protein PLY59_01620, partial [Clostridiales bacterium]|nr:hypothetical protein [Clostridiales bacterium]